MNDRISNRLNMVGACVGVAESPGYRTVWDGQPPAAFGVELAILKTSLASVLALAAQASSPTTGTTAQKDLAETALENAAYPLARALALHFKKTGNLTQRATGDLSLTALQEMRTQHLIAKTKEIRDLADVAKTEPGATDRGVTDAGIAALTAAIAAYEPLANAPRAKIVNRAVLRRELETRTTELVASLRDLDDLVLQFHGTPLGRRFITAWESARIIIDAGHGPTAPAPPHG